MTLSELRKDVKALGFKVKTSRNSMGRFVTYEHPETGLTTDGNVWCEESLAIMKPLFDYLQSNKEKILTIAENEGEKLYGIIKG